MSHVYKTPHNPDPKQQQILSDLRLTETVVMLVGSGLILGHVYQCFCWVVLSIWAAEDQCIILAVCKSSFNIYLEVHYR